MNEHRETLIVEVRDNMACLTLNRPSVLNALNKPLLIELKRALEEIGSNTDIQAVFFTGAGDKAFSAGADIEYLNKATPLQVRDLARIAISVNRLIENLNKITFALINGFALGGGLELAEACMFRLAVPSARLGHPEVRIGAVAGWGGTTRLPRLVGRGRAVEMLLTGKMVNAEEALQMGLIHRIVEQGRLKTEGERLFEEIRQNAPLAVSLTWEAIHRGLDLPVDESAELGADYFGLAASTEDFREGTRAFLYRQKPRFRGR
jgi:enoyl-CoA hydratase